MWLAMNLRRTPDGQRDFPLDLDAIAALLASYYATDTWASVERPRGRTQVHLVIGGRSHVLTPGDQERAQRAAREHDQVTVHVMPEAGHWVHVDAPTELTSLLIDVCGGATR
jgi:pimeloyl-ACP methyl ester carboxylesterase